jgi:hypothetical protein
MKRHATTAVVEILLFFLLMAIATMPVYAQTCATGDDMDAAMRASVDGAAQRFFQLAQQGDTATMQQDSISAVASNFTPIATAINDAKTGFAGAQMNIRGEYVLDNSAPSSTSGRAEFYCGIYNSPNRVGFVFPQLPTGKYGVVIMDVTGGKTPYLLSLILQQEGGQWKLAGFYPKAEQIAGHNAPWYVIQARDYKQKGQLHNAWFYYQLAYDMWQPFPAMNAPTLDKLYDEMVQAQPNDLPLNGPVTLAASNGRTYQVTAMFPAAVGDSLDLVVKYQVPDVSDTAKAFQDNTTVINALVAKYPELRNAFAGVVARAVAPSGQDYGTLLAMKDVK